MKAPDISYNGDILILKRAFFIFFVHIFNLDNETAVKGLIRRESIVVSHLQWSSCYKFHHCVLVKQSMNRYTCFVYLRNVTFPLLV